MTHEEISVKAEALRQELIRIASVEYGNYQDEQAEYRRILNDMLVLIREGAKTVAVVLAPLPAEAKTVELVLAPVNPHVPLS